MKKLRFSDLFAMGIGTTIGAGVFTLTGVAMGYTGGSVFLAYLLGSLIIVFCMLPTIIAGSVVPRTGCFYVLSKETFSSKITGFHFWTYFVGRITMASNATAFAMYFTSVFTSLNPKAVGIAVILIFLLNNIFGLNAAVRIQKIMNAVLLTALLVFIAVGFSRWNVQFVFNEQQFMSGGFTGLMSAISLLVFSLSGGMSILQYGNMAENPERDIPRACLLIALTVALLFAAIGIVTAGVLPTVPLKDGGASVAGTAFFGGPNKAVLNTASAIFSGHSGLFVFFVLGGACFALTTSINSAFPNYATSCIRAAEDGWLPKAFLKRNRFGAPYRLYLAFVALAAIPILLSKDIVALNASLVKVSSGLQILTNLFPNLALLFIQKHHKAEWERSRFYMPAVLHKLVAVIPNIGMLLLVYFNFITYSPSVLRIVLAICGIGIVYAVVGDLRIKRANQISGV